MSYQKEGFFAGFHQFVGCINAFLVWFGNLISVCRPSFIERPDIQAGRLEDVFTCDICTAVITIAIESTRRKQPHAIGLIICTNGNERIL